MDADIGMIIVKYSCFKCGIKEVDVRVPAREDEDVVDWFEAIVSGYIQKDHLARSPGCDATSVQDLMIPIAGSDRLGGPTLH